VPARFLEISMRSLNELFDSLRSAQLKRYVTSDELALLNALGRRLFPALGNLKANLRRTGKRAQHRTKERKKRSHHGKLTSVIRFRRSGLLQLAIVLLLSWTAADLVNASLCAVDSDGLAQSDAAITAHAADPIPPPTSPVDDCFCCSHSVDVGRLMVVLDSTAVAPISEMSVPAAPLSPPHIPFHPPRV
jgi:hypothetical protein